MNLILIYKYMLMTRESILKVDDKYNINDRVLIHFPMIGDVVECTVKESSNFKVLLTFTEDSDLYNCPDFWFKKLNILGKVKNS